MFSLPVRRLALSRSTVRSSVCLRQSIAVQTRTYANEPSRGSSTRGEPGPSTNVRDSPSASQESSEVNANRGAERNAGAPDTASVQKPVSNPEESGLGGQEEPQGGNPVVKNDPNEPADVKRSRTEAEGQKPLDPANK